MIGIVRLDLYSITTVLLPGQARPVAAAHTGANNVCCPPVGWVPARLCVDFIMQSPAQPAEGPAPPPVHAGAPPQLKEGATAAFRCAGR
jgi:hypothetical protein